MRLKGGYIFDFNRMDVEISATSEGVNLSSEEATTRTTSVMVWTLGSG